MQVLRGSHFLVQRFAACSLDSNAFGPFPVPCQVFSGFARRNAFCLCSVEPPLGGAVFARGDGFELAGWVGTCNRFLG